MDKKLIERAKEAVNYEGRTPLGLLTPEDIALIVVPPEQDQEVIQAVLGALKEKGITAEAVFEHDLVGIPYNELLHHNGAEGWKELLYLWECMGDYLISRSIVDSSTGKYISAKNVARDNLPEFLRQNKKFTAVYLGTSGGSHLKRLMKDQGYKFKGNWDHLNKERFLSKMTLYPSDIIFMLDGMLFEDAAKVEEIRCTDPAGTYFTTPVSEEEAKIWDYSQKALVGAASGQSISHVKGLPLMGYRLLCVHGKVEPKPFKIPKSNGVIAGTCGHYGYYPHMKVFIRDGWIERIEGGGKMGVLLREIMARMRDVHYPGLPGPGWGYLNDIAIGTSPKGFRNSDMFDTISNLPNMFDRLRSGVIHWGFGAEHYSEEFLEFVKKNNLPYKHCFHVHTYFTTYEMRFRGSKEWHKVIDNGHLTALDDPRVRALASKYGNPDDLLREEWYPPIPGISYPGDYMRDFGNDPSAWVWKELNGLLPKTIGVPQ